MTPDCSVLLSYALTMLSAALACSGVFVEYAQRRNAVLMASAGLLLTFMWMVFGRVYY